MIEEVHEYASKNDVWLMNFIRGWNIATKNGFDDLGKPATENGFGDLDYLIVNDKPAT